MLILLLLIPCHFRQSDQSWGLRLVGGHDVGTLLKVEKVKLLQKYSLYLEVALRVSQKPRSSQIGFLIIIKFVNA